MMAWVKFLAAIQPEIFALARYLYVQFDGNANSAKLEIKRIANHSKTYLDEQTRNDATLAALKKLSDARKRS